MILAIYLVREVEIVKAVMEMEKELELEPAKDLILEGELVMVKGDKLWEIQNYLIQKIGWVL